MVQAVGGTNTYYPSTPTQGVAPVAPTGGTYTGAYQTDAYSGTSYAPTSMAASGTISSIVTDPKAASRFSLFMINSPQRLLSIGGGMGAIGRGFINLLAGNIPL